MNLPSHGANPQHLYEKVGVLPPNKYIDFSANINPLGPPSVIKEKWDELYSLIMTYPDPHGDKLKEMLAKKESISKEGILIGNGAAEIISLIGRMLAGKRVLLIQPTFSEYEQVCRLNGCLITYYYTNEKSWEISNGNLEQAINKVDAVFFCNPNNPTGIYYTREQVQQILQACKKNDCYFILDEAFYDFVIGYENTVPLLRHYHKFIILRSMTKMFSVPGIRLGYTLAEASIIKQLSSLQTHWSINGIALKIGELLIEKDSFIEKTKRFIQLERDKLCSSFKAHHLEVSTSQVNYYLLRDPLLEDQQAFFHYLLKKGIVARHTYNYPGLEGQWLRFAVKSTEENYDLQGAVTEWIQNRPSFL